MGVELNVNGKVALISGGSRGIGAAAVRLFSQAGAKVVFNYQKASAQAEKLVAELGHDKTFAVQTDMSSAEAAGELVRAAVAKFGRVDILVANHGIWPDKDVPIDQMSEEQWRRTIDINLDSVFGLVKHSVGQMKKQSAGKQRPSSENEYFSNGHVVIISSTAGQRGEANHCDYAASKGAVISMVKGLSTELAPFGVYVNCVAPGWVYTDMAAPALQDEKVGAWVRNSIPLRRAGKPEEIAACVLFLCTPHAGFVTGEIMNVNGGAVLVG
jgi:3-oxoacyl-[acyl-carrier protein] reductase